MITIKNAAEIKLMKEAGRIAAIAKQEVVKRVKPGVTTKYLNDIVEKAITSRGATCNFKGYGGFPAGCCVSVNDELVHGIPGNRVLKEGDIVTFDLGCTWKGYQSDTAITVGVGKIDEEAQLLLKVTKEALNKGIEQAKVGNRVGDISHAIQQYVESFGFHLPRNYTGHGIGRELHEDPYVPNFGEAGRGPKLREGMAIAIEPMVQAGTKETRVKADGWTVVSADGSRSAHFENTVVIAADGAIITTELAKGAE